MNASSRQFPRFSLYIKLTLLAFVVFAVSFGAYLYSEKQIDRANEIRAQSDQLADELRQSSDDLTRMARTYVATSNPIYKQHFQDILAIRDGKKPRPLDYGHDFWAPKLPDAPPIKFGAAVPLLTLMQQAGFTHDELTLFTRAKTLSDKLTETEMAAMRLLESTQPNNDLNRLQALRLLHDDAYALAKAQIMAPIREFHDQSEKRIVEEEGLPPEYLELELTEGVTMQDPQAAIATMNDLHDRGIRMSIDDFGTGYSSLNHLKKFKVYKLKIDQSFVRDISTDPEDKAIVGAVIQMAQRLGLLTIAEGVETTGQLAFLREQGCDEIQGYYYSKPLGADAFEVFVTEHAHKGSLL